MINGNAVGGIVGYGKTFILTDESGNELTAVVTDEVKIFDADPLTDIREGKTAATDAGIVVGAKNIPAYHVSEGYKLITAGSKFVILVDEWDYTKLQVIICPFNTSLANSVSAEKVVIGESVYNVGSADVVSTVVKDSTNEWVDLGITNNTENRYLVRYFMYKEEY